MSDDNSVFKCRTCDEILKNKKSAYRHIKTGYGFDLDSTLERKFLQELRVF